MPWRCRKCRQKCDDTGDKKGPKCPRKGCNYSGCDWEEDTTGVIKNGKHQITDASLDKDMQKYGLDTKVSAVEASQMLDNGRIQALAMLLAKADMCGVKLKQKITLANFKNNGPLYKAQDGTAKHAEWTCETTGTTVGNHPIKLTVRLKIDIDDIPPGKETRGPDRPHVGWTLEYFPSGSGSKPADKFNGHVFIDRAYVSRNTTEVTADGEGEEEEGAARAATEYS